MVSAAALTKLAHEIDQKGIQVTEEEKTVHLGYVSGAIMQSVAALESEIWTIYNHGLGHHLGSDGIDRVASETLNAVSTEVDKISILPKYNLALKLSRQKELDLGSQPMQDTKLLINLRNEITHYKSLFTEEIENKQLFTILKQKDSVPPSFFVGEVKNFYPLHCLTYRRSKWALNTAISFIEHFYAELGIESPLARQNRNLIQMPGV